MVRFCFVILSFLYSVYGQAQLKEPVEWKFTAKKISATTYEIYLTAKIEEDWHIYSQSTPAGGPIPTSISFLKNPLVTLSGPIREAGKLEKRFERLFGVEVMQFSDKVDFIQTVTVKPNVKTALTGTLQYMTCNDEECIPARQIKFSVPLK